MLREKVVPFENKEALFYFLELFLITAIIYSEF